MHAPSLDLLWYYVVKLEAQVREVLLRKWVVAEEPDEDDGPVLEA